MVTGAIYRTDDGVLVMVGLMVHDEYPVRLKWPTSYSIDEGCVTAIDTSANDRKWPHRLRWRDADRGAELELDGQ